MASKKLAIRPETKVIIDTIGVPTLSVNNPLDSGMVLASMHALISNVQRSRSASQLEVEQAKYNGDTWYDWHRNNIIAIVLRDMGETHAIDLSKDALAVLAQTIYGGCYARAVEYLKPQNLKLFVLENNLTHDRLATFYGSKVAAEISTWAMQLTTSEMKQLQPYSSDSYVDHVVNKQLGSSINHDAASEELALAIVIRSRTKG